MIKNEEVMFDKNSDYDLMVSLFGKGIADILKECDGRPLGEYTVTQVGDANKTFVLTRGE